MLFNTATFVGFFAVVYTAYLLLQRWHRAQNVLLLVASLVFYGYWDYRFLALLAVSSGIDFVTALKIQASADPGRRKRLLVLSLASNLTILGFFKYFGFFADSFTRLAALVGLSLSAPVLAVALPVGISFYTFQAMSYVIDVYRRDLEPCRSPIDYGLFIAFFPHLVAGPIQRPSVLLPQVLRPRVIRWEQVNAGIFLIVWGYFKKLVIADNLARLANTVFDHSADYHGLDTLLGALAFTFQIYGDFSGYSDIARGLSKLLGFELLLNFRLPYFALDPADFWRRWHISLSTWLRDYLYVPLGGNRGSKLATYRNLLLTMVLGGLWHGAAWNFVLWGAYHGVVLVLYRLAGASEAPDDPWAGKGALLRTPAKLLLMFTLTVAGWILFRSSSLQQIGQMFTHLGFASSPSTADFARRFLAFTSPLLVIQLIQYVKGDLLAPAKLPAWGLAPLYAAMVFGLAIFGARTTAQFIYFQF